LLSSITPRSIFRTSRWAVLVAVAGALALTPMSDANASAGVVAASGVKLAVTSVGAMIDVNGQLWVSDPSANQVDVFSRRLTGKS
jgi:hypothetical protein